MIETSPKSVEKVAQNSESILSSIMGNIRKVTNRVRNGVANVLEWTKKTAKGSLELLFPQVKEIEEFIMGKNGSSLASEPPSTASVAAASAVSTASSLP